MNYSDVIKLLASVVNVDIYKTRTHSNERVALHKTDDIYPPFIFNFQKSIASMFTLEWLRVDIGFPNYIPQYSNNVAPEVGCT